ncbi:hypothetical protein Tco_1114580 [Tanacetum coccineum]|uniref:Uncharacterized protein n=1 Tax=Tanacetum coccineum TaxID=301880 RepID=A0ABQ5IVH3_9ASTR
MASRSYDTLDTRPNGDALRSAFLKGPLLSSCITPAVPATEDSPAVPEQTTVETVMNMTLENRAHFESDKSTNVGSMKGSQTRLVSVVATSAVSVLTARNFGHYAKECQSQNGRAIDWLAEKDGEIDEQELEDN